MRQRLDVDLEEVLCKSEADCEDLVREAFPRTELRIAEQSWCQTSAAKLHLHGLCGLAALVFYIWDHVAWATSGSDFSTGIQAAEFLSCIHPMHT